MNNKVTNVNLHDLKQADRTEAAGGAALLLHPYVLFRLAGEPAAALKTTSGGLPADLYQQYTGLQADLQPRAAALAGMLETLVQRAYGDNPADAKLLLQLKRDVFNLRPTKVALDALSAWLDAGTLQQTRDVQRGIGALHTLQQGFQAAYDDDMAGAKSALRALFMGNNIRQGMIYADIDMFRDLRRAFEQGETPAKKKKEKILENTFMNYLVRTSMKTSPMSAFTPILQGVWQQACGAPLQRSYAAWRLRTHASLRKGLVHAVVAPQLKKMPCAGRRFRIHPGLRDNGAALVLTDVVPWQAYWRACAERSQLGRSPVLLVLLQVFAAAGDGILAYEDITPRLAANLPAKVHAGLPALVDKLIAGRMLVDADLAFGELEDSVAWAGNILSQVPGDEARAVWQGLQQLDAAVRRHAGADGDERIATAAAVDEALAGLQPHAAQAERLKPAFYENCTFDTPDRAFDTALLDPVREGVEWLLRLSPMFDAYCRYQSALADHFLVRYGKDGVCRDVQAFLEEFPDPVEIRRVPAAASSGMNDELAALRNAFNDLLYARYRAGGDIALNSADLAPFVAGIPQPLRDRTVSYSFHAQFFDCAREPHGMVVNKIYPGHSIMYSRFLDQSSECDPAIHAYLSQLSGSGRYLEVPGVFGLNTNLHPPLAQAELGLPLFPPNLLQSPQVALDSLALHYEAGTHRLVFRMPDGATVDLLYFGMSVPYVLPRLHRILSAMNTQAGLSLGAEVMKTVVQRDPQFDPQQVLRLPRLSLGRLVLGRRAVHIPAAHFPPAHEDEAAFFYGIQQWRQALDLPRDGYLQLAARPLAASTRQVMQETGQEAAGGGEPPRWKPFYIDFANPLLVRLLHRALRAGPGRLVFQEALPGPDDQWLEIAGRKHVAEVQFEASIKGPQA